MAEKKLSEMLKAAKTKPMRFVFVAKGTTGKLLMAAGKVPPKSIEAAMKETSGRVVARGICKPEGNNLAFECAQDPPGTLENQLKLAIKNEGKMTVGVVARKSGEVIPEDDTEEPKVGAKVGAKVEEEEEEETDGEEEETDGEEEETAGAGTRNLFEEKGEAEPKGKGKGKKLTKEEEKAKAAEEKRKAEEEKIRAEQAAHHLEMLKRLGGRLKDCDKRIKELAAKVDKDDAKEYATRYAACRTSAAEKDYDAAFNIVHRLEEDLRAAWMKYGNQDEVAKTMMFDFQQVRARLDAKKAKLRPATYKELDELAKATGKLIEAKKWPEGNKSLEKLYEALFEALKVRHDPMAVVDAKDDDAATLEWKAKQRENLKQKFLVTGKVKDLLRRAGKLKHPGTAPLKKVIGAMKRGIERGYLDRVELGVEKISPLVAKAEEFQRKADEEAKKNGGGDRKAKLEEDRRQKAKFTGEIKELAKRVVLLPRAGSKPLRNDMTGLFKLVNTRKWDEVQEGVTSLTARVEEAERVGAQA